MLRKTSLFALWLRAPRKSRGVGRGQRKKKTRITLARIWTEYWQGIIVHLTPGYVRASLVAAMQETQVRSLGWEEPLEEGMATNSIVIAWEIPWTEKPGGLLSIESQRVGHNWRDWACTQHILDGSGKYSYFLLYFSFFFLLIRVIPFTWNSLQPSRTTEKHIASNQMTFPSVRNVWLPLLGIDYLEQPVPI